MTGDYFRVMYAIARSLDTDLFTCSYGDPALAKVAHVHPKTVQRARQRASERGHIEESFHGCKGTAITPILHSERGQIVQVQESKRGPKRGLKRGLVKLDSLAESSESAPISHISHISQERKDSAADAAAPDSKGAQESNAGHVNSRDGATISAPTSGTTESVPAPTYVFEGTTIKLTARDYNEWEKSFTYLDLRAELQGLDGWATREGLGKNWYHPVRGALAKSNREAKAEIERIRAEAEAATKFKAAPKQHRVIL